MKRAFVAAAGHPEFQWSSGRLRLPFQIDGLRHVVHALYHHAPDLPPLLWRACIEDLVLACLVDFATASLSAEARTMSFMIGRHGESLFRSAAEALRLEVLADYHLPVNLLPVRVRGVGRPRRASLSHESDANRVLLLMGGGKDSLYTYHLLRRANYDVRCFYLTEARRTWQQLRRVYAALENQVRQHRVYLDVNRRGAVSGRYGWLYQSQFQIGQAITAALPYAIADRCRYLALGLERSSDTPMFYYLGRPVNHQHQKSSAFICQFNRHLAWRFRGAIQVISPLHGLYDMGIYARFLSSAPELVPYQSSCGGANSRSPHCGRCEKCAFLAALFAGLGGDRNLYRTLFPRDPMQNPQLYDVWLSQIADRPLTCAGFGEEVRLALTLARNRGWRGRVLEERSVHPLNVGNLENFLRVHPNRLLPKSMHSRIIPLLNISVAEWMKRLA